MENKLIEMLDQALRLNEEKNKIIERHYQDMKCFADSYSNLAAQLMGIHAQQNPMESRPDPVDEDEVDHGLMGGALDGQAPI